MRRLLPRVLGALCAVMIPACDAAETTAPPALVELTLRAVRCPQCGWIESKREIARPGADARALPSYEYTVRLGDGSSRVFREDMPVSWRLGERLIYIEGTAPLN